jgi:signal transduction histidine kinase
MSAPSKAIDSAVTAAPARRQWSLRRWTTVTVLVAVLVSTGAIIGGGFAIVRLDQARDRVIKQLDPAGRASDALSNGLVNEETGVRGFALSGREDFLDPYTTGQQQERAAIKSLQQALGDGYPQITADLRAVQGAAQRWKSTYAEPTIAAVRSGRSIDDNADIQGGKDHFDQVRADLAKQSADLETLRLRGTHDLQAAVSFLLWLAWILAAVLIAGVTALAIGLRQGVQRPVTRLSDQVRTVAQGAFDLPVSVGGPSEVVRLGTDVDSMRRRIAAELSALRDAHAALDLQAQDLRRSNLELEQFAYVASHDLQEPLRKVTSFGQLLEDRYHDKLDDRGRQYIDFAVDGAKRMQTLINDLLAFSRVGRSSGVDQSIIAGDRIVFDALANLGNVIDETGAVITTDPMPELLGDASLLTAVFQNLIGNAIKFRATDRVPEIRLSVQSNADEWLFTCSDNGIGIESDYADRIFVIFQRLHPKERYAGTGIGLAMCRKIIEFHRGRIWLDTDGDAAGATFRFTLPRTVAIPAETAQDDSTISEAAPR